VKKDHEIKCWVDGETYLAAKYLATLDDRTLSDLVRVLIKKYISEVLDKDQQKPGPD